MSVAPKSPSRGGRPSKFEAGSNIIALWPGSGLYYPATVTRRYADGRYVVQFQDKDSSVFTLPSSSVVRARSSRSRSRSRSPGRRRRSSSRSPGRTKSPSRVPKSPKPSKSKKADTEQISWLKMEQSTSSSQEDTKVTDRRRSRRLTKDDGMDSAASSSLPLESAQRGGIQQQTASSAVTDGRSQATPVVLESSTGSDAATKPNFEFGGPSGAVSTVITLPIMIFALYSACSPETCSIQDVLKTKIPPLTTLFSLKATAVVLGWLLFHIALYFLPLGRVVYGQTLRDGTKLPYKINAFQTFIITVLEFAALVFYGDKIGFQIDPVYVYDNYLQLAVAATFVSLLLSIFLYAYSFRDGAMLAAGGNTGNVAYDFFIGRELNPRIGSFDLKVFCELRPGLIAWVVINFCMAYTQYVKYGYVSNSMIMVNVFQMIYVADGLFAEQAILTTMDVISDGFGYMLAFGDLAWVPFVYTLQARYLVDRPFQLPTWAVALLIGLNMLGFFIFRAANGQKDQFRSNPQSPAVAHLHTIPTSTGRTLLADGWWAMCRKPNYLGDLMMALAWCGTCGVEHIICYFYFIYFFILLIHRQRRDDLHCERKYGEAWREYVRRVPYRIVPGVF